MILVACIQYSVFSYSPSVMTNERINLGVFFCFVDKQKCEFMHTSNWTRVSAFDDELNLSFLKDFLKDIRLELNGYCQNFSSRQSFLSRFVNEFQFSKLITIDAINTEEFVINTLKIQLRYDDDKSNRLTIDQQKNYAKQYLKSINVKYQTAQITGHYNEPISFDYIVDEHAFKHFNFRTKQIPSMYASVHSWRDIAREMKNMYKPVFIYDIDDEEAKSEHYLKIIEMLKDSDAQVVDMTSAINLMNTFVDQSKLGTQLRILE